MIDASFGFEMETFEFLNICQVCDQFQVCRFCKKLSFDAGARLSENNGNFDAS